MEENILDLVFEDEEVIFTDYWGFEVGKVAKITNIWGKDRHVEYLDEYGHSLGSARDIYPLLGGTPYVEFYDKDKQPIGRAYVREEIFSGRRKIEYTTNDKKTIHTRYVDEETVQRNENARKKKAGEEEKEKEKNTTPPPEANASTPVLLCCFVFLSIALSALFSFLHSHIHTIIHYAKLISIYGVCPLMVVLHLLLCRAKGASKSVRTFRLVHLILYTAGFAALAYMMEYTFTGREFEFLTRMTNTTLAGFLNIFLFFAPTLVLGFVSGIWTLIGRKKNGHGQREEISRRSMTLMRVGNLVLISVSMALMLFDDTYGTNSFGTVFGMTVLLLFLALLLTLTNVISYLPYRLMSNKF